MAVQVQVLFDKPQQEIKALLQARLDRCQKASLVSGFVTIEGIEAIAPPIRANPAKVNHIVVGAGTYRAYEAFDGLIGSGVPLDRFFVHLGHSRPTSSTAKYRFLRYHPMLHSKVYLLDMGDGSACAFVGSHNLTGFALLGLNGEAGILMEGQINSPEIGAIQKHVQESVAQSVPYSPGMKEAYSWWSTQFIYGLRAKFDDQPREDEGKRTIVILAVQVVGALPQANDIIYFEIPEALRRIQSFRAEVHVYLFTKRPGTPFEGLARLDEAVASLWCQVLGLEDEQGGVELRADWYFDDRNNPELKRAPKPFRPRPSARMPQVRVKVWNKVFAKFEYLFESKKTTWEPVFSKDSVECIVRVRYRASEISLPRCSSDGRRCEPICLVKQVVRIKDRHPVGALRHNRASHHSPPNSFPRIAPSAPGRAPRRSARARGGSRRWRRARRQAACASPPCGRPA
jgi:hypothetical protein